MNQQPEGPCAACGGTWTRQSITHAQLWGDRLYRFEDVPALVCSQCGEVWLGAEVSQWIDRMIQEQPAPARYEQVPVFIFAALQGRAASAGL